MSFFPFPMKQLPHVQAALGFVAKEVFKTSSFFWLAWKKIGAERCLHFIFRTLLGLVLALLVSGVITLVWVLLKTLWLIILEIIKSPLHLLRLLLGA
ncbi:hypothetical protein [Acanthopleuribacter pedis]|uniref:Uncharacterized protein n=1 Tax=Acanthopleuribacter pedis TaxID=442870 RepID=A0A8J7QJT8_9BACT|nr:hypothetical protein [Acanthopleuribacter pedis]MBO1319538.1 hypothetical protein [Acanthopleuribacter pedis]